MEDRENIKKCSSRLVRKRLKASPISSSKTKEAELPRYEFETLWGPEDIRVLEILETTSRIECKLRRTKVSESSYQALSYVWGNDEKPFEAVICDDEGIAFGRIALTESLQNALCNLRDCSELKSKVFWIDQVCINQDDNGEKSRQVGLMGEIYKNASRVIVYTGPAEELEEERAGIELSQLISKIFKDSCYLILSFDTLAEAVLERQRLLPALGIPVDLQYDTKLPLKQQIDLYVSKGWRWLCSMAYARWNRRLWMVQEQLLNRQNIILRGSNLLSWDSITLIPILFYMDLLPKKYHTLFWLTARPDSRNSSGVVADAMFLHCQIRREWDKRSFEEIPSKDTPMRPTLLTNLSYYQYLECRDSRDRIYALLAISADTQLLALAPDYSLDLKSVSIQASIAILRRGKSLEPLAFACRWACSDTILPSWALNLLPRSEPLPPNLSFRVLAPHPHTFRSYAPRFASNDTALIVRGRILDRLSTHESSILYTVSFENGSADNAWVQTAVQILESWSSVLLHLGVNAKNTVQLYRAIMALKNDWAFSARDLQSQEEDMIFCFWSKYRRLLHEANLIASKRNDKIENWHRLESAFRQLAPLLSGRVDTDTIKPTDLLTNDEHQAANNSWDSELIHGRSFSPTQKGRICNSMHEVRPGDAVAVLDGADRLYVMRPVGDKFRLVGDAFIPDLMHGEAYEGLDPDQVDYDIGII